MANAARVPYQPAKVPDSPNGLSAYLGRELFKVARSGARVSIKTQIDDYTLSGADEIVLMDTTATNLDAVLPRADGSLNFLVTVKNIGANTVTVVGDVDGATDPTLAQWESVTIACDGTQFLAVGAYP